MDRLTADVIAICAVAAFALGGFAQTVFDARRSKTQARWVLLAQSFGVLAAVLAALSAAILSRWFPAEIRRAGPYLRELLTASLLVASLRYFLWRMG